MRFFRFLLVGGAAATIQLLVLSFCLYILDIQYQFAAAFAYFASVVFHFLANRKFTFELNGAPKTQEVIGYLLLVTFNFIITMLVTIFVVEVLELAPYVATIISIGATICITFIASKYFIFKKRESV